jgi:hypothetical protein
MFTGSDGKSKTAHFWLNRYSSGNKIYLSKNEIYIDEGRDNEFIQVKN